MYRTRDWRRHKDFAKAIRKRNKDRSTQTLLSHDWYDNLHQYSKNKIHCSCPMCRGKIKNPGLAGPAECWPIQDQKKKLDQDQQIEELEEAV